MAAWHTVTVGIMTDTEKKITKLQVWAWIKVVQKFGVTNQKCKRQEENSSILTSIYIDRALIRVFSM